MSQAIQAQRRPATSALNKYGNRLHVRLLPVVAVACSCVAGLLSHTLGARQVFRSGVYTVPVYATVHDSNGRLVPNLTKEAFRILDNGKPVDITVFSNEPQPLRVAVMLDVSNSVHAVGRRGGVNSVLAFMRALGPADRASLGTFGAEIAVGANLTNDLAEFERVLREEVWIKYQGTPLWQAISEAVTSLSGETGRRVVLAYTDGVDTGSLPNWRGNRSAVERQASEHDCMIYFVRPVLKASRGPLTDEARKLADATGGGHFQVPEDGDLEAAFAGVADELRHQYGLGFSPTRLDGKMHGIEVRMTRPQWKARARSTYLAAPQR
jgi:Ca-activated chloride channel family protein